MKKRIKLLLIISIILMTTGCAEIEMGIDINKDKSMNLSIIEAFDKKLIDQSEKDTYNKQIEEIEKEGFKVKEYNKNGMIGYQFIKPISNIDKVSTKEKTIGDLSILFDESKKNTEKLFTVKKGLFKNRYTVKLKSSDIEAITEQAEIANSTKENQDDVIEDPLLQMPDEDISKGPDLSALGIKANITVNLPYKALKNNATSVEKDGKKLTWDFATENNIEFEFELYNMTTIYTIIGLIIVLLIIIGYYIFKKKYPNKNLLTQINALKELIIKNYKNKDKTKIANPINKTENKKPNKQEKSKTTEKDSAVKTTKKSVTTNKSKNTKAKAENIEVLDLNETSKTSYKKE